ncbi:1-acyl-sn-glycerol-3-phosphate acyltransferase, partial [Pseudomonadota bacterium]
IFIDRENSHSAIEAMKPLVDAMRNQGKSVAIAPEGTRSITPKLAPFKKGPFHLAMQANKVTPITLPAVGCMVLLGAAPRALTIEEFQTEALSIVRWAHARGVRLTSDFRPERLSHVQDLAEAMVGMGLLIRYDEGLDTVFGIEPGQHPMAGYYRNTIIHHFVNKAIIELALLKASDVGGEGATDVFWNETLRLRNFFKFEFFYPSKKKFKRQLKDELERSEPAWQEKLGAGGEDIMKMLAQMQPLLAHATLLSFVEAYSVVFDLLVRTGKDGIPDEEDFVAQSLKAGKQAYLQRRITSEASIGKILFQNGYKLAENFELTRTGSEDVLNRRIRLLMDFKELSRMLERIRLMALSSHGEN